MVVGSNDTAIAHSKVFANFQFPAFTNANFCAIMHFQLFAMRSSDFPSTVTSVIGDIIAGKAAWNRPPFSIFRMAYLIPASGTQNTALMYLFIVPLQRLNLFQVSFHHDLSVEFPFHFARPARPMAFRCSGVICINRSNAWTRASSS